MNLAQIKEHLKNTSNINFILPNGSMVPQHFHVTEVGLISKHFIDCGGTIRDEKVINFQLWSANDIDHRLKTEKLLNIIHLSETKLGIPNLEIEVEYQSETIGKYGLDFDGINFLLTQKQTACLASDSCGIPNEKLKVALSEIGTANSNTSCKPGGGCC
jgi:hypothetical protein